MHKANLTRHHQKPSSVMSFRVNFDPIKKLQGRCEVMSCVTWNMLLILCNLVLHCIVPCNLVPHYTALCLVQPGITLHYVMSHVTWHYTALLVMSLMKRYAWLISLYYLLYCGGSLITGAGGPDVWGAVDMFQFTAPPPWGIISSPRQSWRL